MGAGHDTCVYMCVCMCVCLGFVGMMLSGTQTLKQAAHRDAGHWLKTSSVMEPHTDLCWPEAGIH